MLKSPSQPEKYLDGSHQTDFYQWTVHEHELPHTVLGYPCYPKTIRSPVFFFTGKNNGWTLNLTSDNSLLTLRLCSDYRQEKFENLEFFINNHRVSKPIDNGNCGVMIISIIDRAMFFLHIDSTASYGTVTVQSRDFSNVNLCTSLVRDFGDILDSGKFSDFVIETGDGTRIPVHRNVLSARSPVFSAMLDSDMMEAKSGCLKIDDLETETVKNMVAFLYTSRLPKFSADSAIELLKAADKYDLKDLKQVCRQSLSTCLTIENATEMLLLADTYREDALKEKVLYLISKNRSKFTNPESFEGMSPSLLIDVIMSITKS